MTLGEAALSLVYVGAFTDPTSWSQDDHLAGLRAVFAAGEATQRKADAEKEVSE